MNNAQVDNVIQNLLTTIAKDQRCIEFLILYRSEIEEINCPIQWMGDTLDFNLPSRSQVLAIIKKFPGKWEKCKVGSIMHYTLTKEDARFPLDLSGLRLYSAELPPSCKIIKKTRTLPAIPERVEKYEEISCEVPQLEVTPESV